MSEDEPIPDWLEHRDNELESFSDSEEEEENEGDEENEIESDRKESTPPPPRTYLRKDEIPMSQAFFDQIPKSFLPTEVLNHELVNSKDLDLFVCGVEYTEERFRNWDYDTIQCSQYSNIEITGVTKVEQGYANFVLKTHEFKPYMYMKVPQSALTKVANGELTLDNVCVMVHQALENHLASEPKNFRKPPYVVDVEIEQKQSAMFYSFGKLDPFMKITFCVPSQIPLARTWLLADNTKIDFMSGFEIFEAGLAFPLRFMVDCGFAGNQWISLPAYKYSIASEDKTFCAMELHCSWKSITPQPMEGKYAIRPPLRMFGFDYEVRCKEGKFPNAKEPYDAIILITVAATTTDHIGKKTAKEMKIPKVAFTYKPPFDSEEAEKIFRSSSETEMLEQWSMFQRMVQPNIWVSYNGENFDLPYGRDRAKLLGIESFMFDSAMPRETTMMQDNFTNTGSGTTQRMKVVKPGCIFLDLLPVVLRANIGLENNKLDSVCKHFLELQKVELPFYRITPMWESVNDDQRRRLTKYGLKDADLTIRLAVCMVTVQSISILCNVSNVTFELFVQKGQNIRSQAGLAMRCKRRNLVFPYIREDKREAYRKILGALVHEPRRGLYVDPVSFLDFTSMYPTAIMAENIDYSSQIHPNDLHRVPKSDRTFVEHEHYGKGTGSWFINSSIYEGMVPETVREATSKREIVKKRMSSFKEGSNEWAVLNEEQTALKLHGNSQFGIYNAKGYLRCAALGASVTRKGREENRRTTNLVMNMFAIGQPGILPALMQVHCLPMLAQHVIDEKITWLKSRLHEVGVEVIYGDTDSLVLWCQKCSLEEALSITLAAERESNATYKPPMKISYEKIFRFEFRVL